MSEAIGTSNEDAFDLERGVRKQVRQRSLRLLGSLIKPQLRLVLGTLTLIILSTLARVLRPALIGLAINNAIVALQSGNWVPLGLTGGGYIVAAIAGGVLFGLYTFYTAKLSQAMLLELRRRVFRHTQRLSLEFHEKYTSGRIIARQTSDLEALRELLDQGVGSLFSGFLFMIFTLVSIFTLDWRSGLVVVVAFIPAVALARWYQIRSERIFRASRVISAQLIVHFVETMTGIRAIKAFRKEKAADKKYTGLANEYRDITVDSIRLFGVLQPGLILIGNLTVASVLLFGGFRVLDGTLAVGTLVSLVLYAKQIFQPVEQIATFYSSFQSAAAALEKVSGLLEEAPTVVSPKNPVPLKDARGAIKFTDAEFGYGDGPTILPKFNLDIPAGQTVAVVGQTGAGKSTLAKLIARFYDVTGGSLTLDGVELRDLSNQDLRRAVVMVTQEAFLFSGTVAENIALGNPDATQEQIEAAAKAVGAHDFIMSLPEGYNTDVNKRGGRVSAGQRQLLSFARAFLADPAVLILDEATSSLDIPSERLVQEGLAKLLGNRTAIIIAHRLSTVEIADRVLVIHDGAIAEDGTPEELSEGDGRFAQLNRAWKDSLV